MSEQEKPKSFMQELDRWTEANVIMPLSNPQLEWDGRNGASEEGHPHQGAGKLPQRSGCRADQSGQEGASAMTKGELIKMALGSFFGSVAGFLLTELLKLLR